MSERIPSTLPPPCTSAHPSVYLHAPLHIPLHAPPHISAHIHALLYTYMYLCVPMCTPIMNLIGLLQKRPLWSKAWCCVSEILLKIGRFGGGKSYLAIWEGKSSVWFTPPNRQVTFGHMGLFIWHLVSRVFWVKFLFLSQHLKREVGFFNFTTLLLIIYSLLQYNIHLCEICCCKCSKVAFTFYQNIILGKMMKSINLMKNVGRFTPLKSPSPIYPQIVCMIYPPKIAKSNLPSNHLYNLPPRNCQVWFTLKSSIQFTPPKSPSQIYPQIVCMIYPQIVCTIYPQIIGTIYPPSPQLTLNDFLMTFAYFCWVKGKSY